MLYLLTYNSEGKQLYKVGYTENMKTRMYAYRSSCPTIKEVSTKEGGPIEEFLIHRYLHQKYKGDWEFFMNEWYICDIPDERIKDEFSRPLDDIRKDLWDNFRNDILDFTKSYDEWEDAQKKFFDVCSKNYGLSGLTDEELAAVPKDQWNTEATARGLPVEVLELYRFFLDNKEFCTRMKEYCRVMSSADKTVQSKITGLVKFHEYYYLLGPEKIRALSFEESKIVHEVNYRKSQGNLRILILQEFGGKEKISKSEAKVRIQRIYDEAGLKRTAKATDLREYFDTSECRVLDDSGKLVHGIRLLSIK